MIFKHIVTNYSVGEWDELREKVQANFEQNICDFLPVFLKPMDFLYPFNQYSSLIIDEWRKYKKIAVVLIDNCTEWDILDKDLQQKIFDNTVRVMK